MKFAVIFCRILLGAGFVFFGLNGLLQFWAPKNVVMPADAMTWSTIMMTHGWMKVVAILQILGGLLVLAGVTVPLGLMILIPITFNILCFHMCLTNGAMIMPGILTGALEVILAWFYRPYLAGIFSTKAQPVYSR